MNIAKPAIIGCPYVGVSEQNLIRGKLCLIRAGGGNSGIAGRTRFVGGRLSTGIAREQAVGAGQRGLRLGKVCLIFRKVRLVLVDGSLCCPRIELCD